MFRKTIIAEMKRQGLSRYALAERVAYQVPRTCTYDYLAGRTDMAGERVAVLCKALGLTLKQSKGRK